MNSLLSERGYEGVTFEEVARRAGASKATLYRRWDSKRDMVIAALKAGPARRDGQDEIDTGSLRDDLLALCRRLAQSMRSADSQAALLLLQAGLEDPDLCEEIERSIGPTGARLPSAVIEAAVGRGELPEGVDPFPFEEVAGAVTLLRRLNGLCIDDHYLEALVDSVLRPALHATAPMAHELPAGIFSGRPSMAQPPKLDAGHAMSQLAIDGFHYQTLPGEQGIDLNVAVGGTGPALVLLHGFPQTHYMWRDVARELVARHTVIVPDLRGYGESSKPPEREPETYSKRTMAQDVVKVARALGHERFGLVGHDRGALVGVRAGLDHPQAVQYLGILDVLPTLDTWDVLHGVNAKVAWHMFLMAQPMGLPEKMIHAVGPEFFSSFLDAWDPDGSTFTPEVRQYYIDSSVNAVDSIVADYRATASIDLDMDREDRAAGRRLAMPVGVISQDWGSQLGFDAAALWRAWAPDLTFEPIQAGHFMAEEKPAEITHFISELAERADS